MEKIERVFPYLLLVGYISVAANQQLSLAHSLIVAALAGFAGFASYLKAKEKPDYELVFQERLNQQDKQIKELQDFIGKQSVQGGLKQANYRW